jgi:hypothetical protein
MNQAQLLYITAFDPDEARDEHGRWTRGGETPSLKQSTGKAWNGNIVPVRTPLSKQDVGKLGEAIAIGYLKTVQGLSDARHLNSKLNNFPVDLIQDHGAIEVKTGLVSNGKSAQQWRATIGQPGKAETAWLKTASAEDKAKWNHAKSLQILDRKNAALAQLSKELGKKVKASTLCMIVNPDKKTVDIYQFKGFHLRIGWTSPEAKKGFVGSFKYGR